MPLISKAALLLAGVAGVSPATHAGPIPATNPPTVTVRQVVTMQALAGQTVVVTGRCLGRDAQAIAVGSRPYSGKVWQLEDNGTATWVIGEMPESCGTGTATVKAQVVQDTQPLFSPPRTLRQYLVIR